MLVRSLLDSNKQKATIAATIKTIITSFGQGSLSFYINNSLLNSLSNIIAENLREDQLETDLKVIKKIIKNGDFYLVADYLSALKRKDSETIELFKDFDNNSQKLYNINNRRALLAREKSTPKAFSAVQSLEDIFSEANENAVFFYDNNFREIFSDIVETSPGGVSEYIESHYDLPGVNSLVRKGLVKTIVTANGELVVSKRDNPDKKGRFATEQNNISKLRDMLGLHESSDFIELKNNSAKAVVMRLISPMAVLKSQGQLYSLSKHQKGKTLEHVLIEEKDSSKRAQYLNEARQILDLLYQKGVIWGDMAPRNIIVDENDVTRNYFILDFEKTKILDRPIKQHERVEHCRGPMCVEEFGAICTKEEVEACFEGYFSVASWDLKSTGVVPFEKPKRELLAIFDAKGSEDFTFGEYNALEREVIGIRFPYFDDFNNETRYPLNICFKIDHYLGSDYDRKATELLMSAKEHELLIDVMNLLESSLQLLDNRFIANEFVAVIEHKKTRGVSKECFELRLLSDAIDSLYLGRDNKEGFRNTINKIKIKIEMMHIREEYLTSKNGHELARRNYECYNYELSRALHVAGKKYEHNILLLAGGFGRKEVTFGSDVDVLASSIDKRLEEDFKDFISDNFNHRMGLDVDFLEAISENDVEGSLKTQEDCLIDYYKPSIVSGDLDFIAQFNRAKGKVFSDKKYLKNELSRIGDLLSYPSEDRIKSIKSILSTLNIVSMIVSNFRGRNKYIVGAANKIKSLLLFYKNESNLSSAGFENATIMESEVLNLVIQDTLKILTMAGVALREDKLLSSQKAAFFNEKLGAESARLSSKPYLTTDITSKSLMQRYYAENVDESVADKKREYLAMSIVSGDTFLISGNGAKLKTNRGQVLDLSSMTVNCILGQGDPWVKANQLAYLSSDRPTFHTSKFGSELYYSLAKRLSDMNIGGIQSPVINHRQCNGSDVVELAVKAAFNHRRGRKNFVSFMGSYHGQNLTAYFVSEVQKKHRFLLAQPNSNVIYLDSPPNAVEVSREVLNGEEIAILDRFREISEDTYGVIIEPIQMNNGVNVCSKAFLRELKNICEINDICLIFDEIQTGFGWLGKLTAAELLGVAPNILAISKALTAGNGPLAVMASEAKYGHLQYGTAEKTNGADVRAVVAAHAVIDRLIGVEQDKIPSSASEGLKHELRKGLLSNMDRHSKLLEKHLQVLNDKYPEVIKEIRGYGGIRGISIVNEDGLPDEEFAKKIIAKTLELGVLVRQTKNVIIVKPPLTITQSELEFAFEIIDNAIAVCLPKQKLGL